MKVRQIVLIALFTFAVASPVPAADIAAGKATANFACAECHGSNGIGVAANFPNLAGQKELYLVAQLEAFKAGKRKFPLMNLLARQLSDADIANVSRVCPARPGARRNSFRSADLFPGAFAPRLTGEGAAQAPATVMPSTRMVGASVPKRNSRSSAGVRFMNMSCSLLATVTSLTG